ncbi:hypothetical protein FI667_g3139, partial [Globisporangium splendens]
MLLLALGVNADDNFFRRRPKTRPVLSEDRRKEILAKLSLERQAALRVRNAGSPLSSPDQSVAEQRQSNSYKTPDERSQLIQKLFQSHDDAFGMVSQGAMKFSQRDDYSPGSAPPSIEPPRSDVSEDSGRHSAVFSGNDDEGRLSHASDIVGKAFDADIQPRSPMDLFYSRDKDANADEEHHLLEMDEEETNDQAGTFKVQYERNAVEIEGSRTGFDRDSQHSHSPSSLFAKILAREYEEPSSVLRHSRKSLVTQDDTALSNETQVSGTTANPNPRRKTVPRSSQEQYQESALDFSSPSQGAYDRNQTTLDNSKTFRTDNGSIRHVPRRATTVPALPKRIEYLAQPWNDKFNERDKQRLLQEMESFQECTFRPNLTKPQLRVQSGDKAVRTNDPSKQHAPSSHVKYEQRECAKAALEAQKLRECTFKPEINNNSKWMLDMSQYKPIHERVSGIQRAKKLEDEEGGLTSFTPSINPRSREIAESVLIEKELEEAGYDSVCGDNSDYPRVIEPPKVTDRLVSDAEKQIEKRVAIQEYYDALHQQPYAPKISEKSSKLVQQKPEFKMDFVSRQIYFQSRVQEKLEAPEDYCERAQNHGERITFKPDIDNANSVLKKLRPDRFAESKNEKLYRMIYNDPKKTELKKQRLREECYSQYTFKPEINPISKALGRTSTLDELSHPVIDLVQDQTALTASPKRKSTSKSTPQSRAALQQYFAGKRFRSRVALEMDQAEKVECTFQPNLIAKPRPKGVSSSTSKLNTKQHQGKSVWRSDNILHLIETDRHKKAAELEAKRNALELKELQECTFQPNTRKGEEKSTKSKAAPSRDVTRRVKQHDESTQKPVIVRGLGRFLQLKEQAKRLQTEQKQREEKAFRPNATYEPRSYTVPKPFNLSEPSKEAIRRRLKLREERRAKERNECTFAPQTIESRHREVLENILNE